jgi:hypothetical protein
VRSAPSHAPGEPIGSSPELGEVDVLSGGGVEGDDETQHPTASSTHPSHGKRMERRWLGAHAHARST